MRFRFEFRRYRLPFRAVVRTAHGPWSEREGVIVRLERVEGEGRVMVGYGEAAPVPGFGVETTDENEATCRALGDFTTDEIIAAVPPRLACLRHALSEAVEEGRGETRFEGRGSREQEERGSRVEGRGSREQEDRGSRVEGRGRKTASSKDIEMESDSKQLPRPSTLDPRFPSTLDPRGPSALGVAALLPAGRAALERVGPLAEAGFRFFKWKVGVGDVADELGLLDDLCAKLPDGAKLRLDANGAWDRRRAERWLERCADRPIEFVEQPCFAEPSSFARPTADRSPGELRKESDLLLGLASDYPTPIALDESLVHEGDVERWIGLGWPGVFVVKPSLLGDVNASLAKLEKAKADVVFSSALETAVGARAALRVAFGWKGQTDSTGSPRARALGFGVWPLFRDARFDGPFAAPFIRAVEVDALNPEAVWNALS